MRFTISVANLNWRGRIRFFGFMGYVIIQGWKLLTVRLSGTGKNSGGQVNILGTFLKES